LLERQVRFLRGRFDPLSVAVSIQAPWRQRCEALDPRLRWVPVPPQASPLAAFQALLKAVPLEDSAFLYHVDMRVWEEGVFEALEAGLRDREAAVPSYAGKKGHPVLLTSRLAADIQELDPRRERLDVFLRGRRVAEVPVPFDCVHDNWNEADDAH
jgi:CTP:molybdopterin cytidylyltransferase MocA